MPGSGDPVARLVDVTVAEVAEAPVQYQLRHHVGDELIAVYSITAEQRALSVLLYRDDDSFVWRVAAAKPMTAQEFETWLGRTTHD